MERTPKPITEEVAYSRLTALCSRAEYCLSDLHRKMQGWLLPEGAETRLLERLKRERYVDETRYAHAFVREKFRQNRWGSRRIALELHRKQIDDEIVQDALTEIPAEDSNATLAQLLRQRLRTVKGKDDTEIFLKLLRFSVGRGYSYEEAHRCLEQLTPLFHKPYEDPEY